MGYIDPKIQNLLTVYDVALKKLDMQLTEAKKAGRVIDYLNQQRAVVENEIATLNKFCAEWSEDVIPGYFEKGAIGAYNDYRAANIDVAKIGSNFPVVENLTNNLSLDLASANNLLGRRITDMVRTAGLEAITMKLSTGATIKQAQSLLRAALDQFGIENITYKNGAKVSIKAYAAMVSRTTTREATNSGTMEQVRALGALGALVQMTESATTCEVCALYEGRVYSVDGQNQLYPPLSKAFGDGYATIHPNCTHNIVPYIPKFDKNREENLKKSNMPFELTPEAQDKVNAYKDEQKAKASKQYSKKMWEKAMSENPSGTPKTFAGWQSQKRAEKKAYIKAQTEKALMQGPPKPPPKAKVEAVANPTLTTWQKKALEYDDFNKFIQENKAALQAEGLFDYDKMTALWKETRYLNSEQGLHELTKEDAIATIRDNIKTGTLDGWFRDADSDYKPILEDLITKNPEVRNAGLNIAYQNYLEYSGKDITFEEFMDMQITVYRGGNNSTFVDADVFRSYTYDPEIAKKFGGEVVELNIIPRFSLGSYQTTGEYEILISPYTIAMGDKAGVMQAATGFKVPSFLPLIDKTTDLDAITDKLSTIWKAFTDIDISGTRFKSDNAFAKNELVTAISNTLAKDPKIAEIIKNMGSTPYDEVNGMIANWATTSGDNNQKAIAMQMAVDEEFKLGATFDHFVGSGGFQSAQTYYQGDTRDLYRAFVRAQYDYTQEVLKANNITSVPLFRGAVLKEPDIGNTLSKTYASRIIEVKLQPASSFSTDYDTAKDFAETGSTGGIRVSEVMFAEVPAERILGTFRSGFGCLDEEEFVVLGTKEPERIRTLSTNGTVVHSLNKPLPMSTSRALQELAGVYDPLP